METDNELDMKAHHQEVTSKLIKYETQDEQSQHEGGSSAASGDVGEGLSSSEDDEDQPEEEEEAVEEQLESDDQMLPHEFDLMGSCVSGEPSPQPQSHSNTQPPIDKQKSFLVAQLVEPNCLTSSEQSFHYNTTSQRLQQRDFQFKMPADTNHEQQESLLAKLMQGQQQQAGDGRNPPTSKPTDEPHQSRGSYMQQHRPSQHKHNQQRNTDTHSDCQSGEQTQTSIDFDEHVKLVDLFGVKIVALTINGKERLCLAQISNTLLKDFSYNEIHNRRVALGITCVQCTPIQLEMLRRAGAMPSSSRRCGMITMREAERLCRSFLAEEQPPELPENFYFTVAHRVNYGCKGRFIPARYISSRAKCIECFYCGEFYSPNKFIFHSHKQPNATDCNPPDSPNINSWRKHINLDWSQEHSQEIKYAWEDVKSLFNGGTRRRSSSSSMNGAGGGGSSSGYLNERLAAAAAAVVASKSPCHELDLKSVPDSDKEHHTSFEGASSKRDNPTAAAVGGGLVVDVVCSSKRQDQRNGPNLMAPLTQNERRKLPIGAWSKERPLQCNGQQQHRQPQIPPMKRSAAHFNQQHHQIKKMPQDNWHNQQQQPKMMANKQMISTSLNERHSPNFYQQDTNSHLYLHDSLVPSASRHSTNNPRHSLGGAGKTSGQSSAGPLSNSDSVHQFAKPCNNYGSQTIPPGQDPGLATSLPSSFIYGQLYSQLMQSQLAQQVSQHQHQQQMSPMGTQMAIRQHIWSSLLANLRCNPGAQFQEPASAQSSSGGHKSASPQVSQQQAYSLQNHHDHQNTGSLLAAAAAAAATNMAARNHHNQTSDQNNAIPTNDLSSSSAPSLLAPSISLNFNPLNNLLPMQMYSLPNPQGPSADVATLFGSSGDSCK